MHILNEWPIAIYIFDKKELIGVFARPMFAIFYLFGKNTRKVISILPYTANLNKISRASFCIEIC